MISQPWIFSPSSPVYPFSRNYLPVDLPLLPFLAPSLSVPLCLGPARQPSPHPTHSSLSPCIWPDALADQIGCSYRCPPRSPWGSRRRRVDVIMIAAFEICEHKLMLSPVIPRTSNLAAEPCLDTSGVRIVQYIAMKHSKTNRFRTNIPRVSKTLNSPRTRLRDITN